MAYPEKFGTGSEIKSHPSQGNPKFLAAQSVGAVKTSTSHLRYLSSLEAQQAQHATPL